MAHILLLSTEEVSRTNARTATTWNPCIASKIRSRYSPAPALRIMKCNANIAILAGIGSGLAGSCSSDVFAEGEGYESATFSNVGGYAARWTTRARPRHFCFGRKLELEK